MVNQTDNQLANQESQNQEAVKPTEKDFSKKIGGLHNEIEAKMHPEIVDSKLNQLEDKLLKACDENADGVIKGRNEAKCKMQFNIDNEKQKLEELIKKDKELDKKQEEADKRKEEADKRKEEADKRKEEADKNLKIAVDELKKTVGEIKEISKEKKIK